MPPKAGWKSTADKAILDFVNEESGSDSKFASNLLRACQDFAPRLRDECEESSKFDKLTMKQIGDKIRSTVRRYFQRGTKYSSVWQLGIAALDPQKLRKIYPGHELATRMAPKSTTNKKVRSSRNRDKKAAVARVGSTPSATPKPVRSHAVLDVEIGVAEEHSQEANDGASSPNETRRAAYLDEIEDSATSGSEEEDVEPSRAYGGSKRKSLSDEDSLSDAGPARKFVKAYDGARLHSPTASSASDESEEMPVSASRRARAARSRPTPQRSRVQADRIDKPVQNSNDAGKSSSISVISAKSLRPIARDIKRKSNHVDGGEVRLSTKKAKLDDGTYESGDEPSEQPSGPFVPPSHIPTPAEQTRPEAAAGRGDLLVERDELNAEDCAHLENLESRAVPPQPDWAQGIVSTMDSLNYDIDIAVKTLLHDLNIHESQPVYFDTEVFLPPKLLELLVRMIGGPIGFANSKFADFLSTQTQQHVNTCVFLRSLLGVAITEWCLSPVPQGDMFWAEHSIMAQVAAEVFGGNIEVHVKHDFLRRHLKENFDPLIEHRSQAMTCQFDQLFKFILPRPCDFNQANVLSRMKSFRRATPHDEQGPNTSPSGAGQREWLENLANIFKRALQWRSDCEKRGNGQYTFRFPMYKDKFERDPAHQRRKPAQYDGDPDAFIVLGFMPRVRRRYKSFINSWSPDDTWRNMFDGVMFVGAPSEQWDNGSIPTELLNNRTGLHRLQATG